jgi:hypothetical protein
MARTSRVLHTDAEYVDPTLRRAKRSTARQHDDAPSCVGTFVGGERIDVTRTAILRAKRSTEIRPFFRWLPAGVLDSLGAR